MILFLVCNIWMIMSRTIKYWFQELTSGFRVTIIFQFPATFTENTQFKIQKCPNQILFFVDNELIKVDALSSSESYEVFIEPKDCYGTGIDKYLTSFMQISDIQTCELYDPFGKHIVLHTKFPTTVSLINGLKLRISYIEKYQTVDGRRS
jgi:hypothetical protein